MERQYSLEREHDEVAMKWDHIPWSWYIQGVTALIARARENARTGVNLPNETKRKIIKQEIQAAINSMIENCSSDDYEEKTNYFVGYLLGNFSQTTSDRLLQIITGLPSEWTR